MKSKVELIKILGSCKEEVKKNYKIEILGVFGFFAWGEARLDSDLDILIRFNQGATLFDWANMDSYIEEKVKFKIDTVPESELFDDLKPFVKRDLIELWENQNLWI